MKAFVLEKRISLIFCILLILLSFSAVSLKAQSTNIEFPTPISANSIKGKIPPRDIGDARLTTHYYVFEGNQGDIFLKIEAVNLNGDIDIFYADNLRPLTKVSLYADSSITQTGREIYLRKPEKLILRVEGRTLNDDAATYSIQFTGSFVAMAATQVVEEPKLAVKNETESDVKVNSVGTILEVKPKPTPKETVAKTTRRKRTKATTTPEAVSTIKAKPSAKKTKQTIEKAETSENQSTSEKKTEVVITDNLPKSDEAEKVKVESSETVAKVEPKATRRKTPAKKRTTTKKAVAPTVPKPNSAAELAQALENIRLVVEFKDGAKIERPMNDVLKFGVDKGILTIINKDGTVGRYSILEIVKITVE